MQLLITLTALASALSLTSAAVPSNKFHIKTQLKEGQVNTDFDGLYVQLYHVGAGFNAAMLTASKKGLPVSTFNKTNSGVDFVIGGQKKYPGRLVLLDAYDTESGWAPVQINTVTEGTGGFGFDRSGHLVPAVPTFSGWRVCNWNHGVPELFHDLEGLGDSVPISCSLVDLVPEFLKKGAQL